MIFALYVDAPDAVATAMEAQGAEVLFPVSDQGYGDRAGWLRDPWGQQWMLARRLVPTAAG